MCSFLTWEWAFLDFVVHCAEGRDAKDGFNLSNQKGQRASQLFVKVLSAIRIRDVLCFFSWCPMLLILQYVVWAAFLNRKWESEVLTAATTAATATAERIKCWAKDNGINMLKCSYKFWLCWWQDLAFVCLFVCFAKDFVANQFCQVCSGQYVLQSDDRFRLIIPYLFTLRIISRGIYWSCCVPPSTHSVPFQAGLGHFAAVLYSLWWYIWGMFLLLF